MYFPVHSEDVADVLISYEGNDDRGELTLIIQTHEGDSVSVTLPNQFVYDLGNHGPLKARWAKDSQARLRAKLEDMKQQEAQKNR